MLNLYKTLVHPHIEYCAPVWSLHYEKDKRLMAKVQNCFNEMVQGLIRCSYPERRLQLGLRSLAVRHNRANLTEVFKTAKGLCVTSLTSVFDLSNHKKIRGHCYKLSKSRPSLEI